MWKFIVGLTSLASVVLSQAPDHWQVNPPDYENTMTMTCEISINGELSADPDFVLAAFNGENCRGVAQATLVGERSLFFLLVYANLLPDSISFQVWDSRVNNTVDMDQEIVFSSGSALGDVEIPQALSGTNHLSYIEAHADSFQQDEDAEFNVALDLLANDVVDTSLPLLVSFPIAPSHGFLLENVDQTFTFVSDLHFFGADSFFYRVSHEFGADSAWVYVDVLPVDDPLTDFSLIEPANATFYEQGSAALQSFSWETPIDYDGDPITYTLYFHDGEELDSSFFSTEPQIDINIESLNRDTWLTWHVKAFDAWGWTESLDTFSLQISALVDVQSHPALPKEFHLGQNYPNPFNPSTHFNFDLPSPADVSIMVYDVQGRIVNSSYKSGLSQGVHIYNVKLDNNTLTNCVSGIYYYQLKAINPQNQQVLFSQTKKMLYLK